MRVAEPMRSDAAVLQSTAVRWIGSAQIWRALAYAAMAVAVVLVGLPMYWMLLAPSRPTRRSSPIRRPGSRWRPRWTTFRRPGARRRSAASTPTA